MSERQVSPRQIFGGVNMRSALVVAEIGVMSPVHGTHQVRACPSGEKDVTETNTEERYLGPSRLARRQIPA